jgi:hypothetical protein
MISMGMRHKTVRSHRRGYIKGDIVGRKTDVVSGEWLVVSSILLTTSTFNPVQSFTIISNDEQ